MKEYLENRIKSLNEEIKDIKIDCNCYTNEEVERKHIEKLCLYSAMNELKLAIKELELIELKNGK